MYFYLVDRTYTFFNNCKTITIIFKCLLEMMAKLINKTNNTITDNPFFNVGINFFFFTTRVCCRCECRFITTAKCLIWIADFDTKRSKIKLQNTRKCYSMGDPTIFNTMESYLLYNSYKTYIPTLKTNEQKKKNKTVYNNQLKTMSRHLRVYSMREWKKTEY